MAEDTYKFIKPRSSPSELRESPLLFARCTFAVVLRQLSKPVSCIPPAPTPSTQYHQRNDFASDKQRTIAALYGGSGSAYTLCFWLLLVSFQTLLSPIPPSSSFPAAQCQTPPSPPDATMRRYLSTKSAKNALNHTSLVPLRTTNLSTLPAAT